MKKILTPLLVSIAPFLLGASVATANSDLAQKRAEIQENIDYFEVKNYKIVASDEILSKLNSEEIANILKEFTGKEITLTKLYQATDKLESYLNKNSDDFTVLLPPQYINDGLVVLEVKSLYGKVNYAGSKGFSVDNVKRSVPSLSKGIKIRNGQTNFDGRELVMAQENPLKQTLIQYKLNSEGSITADVFTQSPRNKHLFYASLDNYGSKTSKYARLILNYLNGGLFDRDDLFTVIALTSPLKYKELIGIGASYSYPFYNIHQKLEISGFYTTSKLEKLPVAGAQKLSLDGSNGSVGIKWTYYLKGFSFGENHQIKASLAYDLKRYVNIVSSGKSETPSKYYLAPVTASIFARNTFFNSVNAGFSLGFVYIGAGQLGTSHTKTITESLGKQDYDYPINVVTYSFNTSTDIKGFGLSANLNGQYSSNNLIDPLKIGTGGPGSVRGAKNAPKGDIGGVLRTEVSTPGLTYRQLYNAKLYIFGDYGIAKNKNPLPKTSGGFQPNTRKVASTGIGTRFNLTQYFAFDIYGAYHIGEIYKLDAKEKLSKFSAWGQVSFIY